MNKFKTLCAASLMVASQLSAGQMLSLSDITRGDFRGESVAAVRALSDGESYAQISDDGQQIVKYAFKTGKQTGILFDAKNTRGANIQRIDGYKMSPDGKHILIQTETKAVYRRSFTAVYYLFNVQNNKLEPLSDGGPQQSPVWSPDGHQVAFVRDNNIFLVKLLYGNSESQVTKDGKLGEVINGIPDWVNEEEFATNSSMVFTADSKQLVWVRYDESKVPMRTLPLYQKPFYSYKYPRAGEDNSRVSLLSYDIKSHQTRTVAVPLDADGYIPRIVATEDASKIAVFTLNRHQDCLRIYMANPLSTVAQLIVEDKDKRYIKEEAILNAVVTSQHLLLTSERDGYNHLYLYGLNGQLQRQLTSGQYEVTDVYGYDEATGDAYYAANVAGPTEGAVYVAHPNGKNTCLTPGKGVNRALFSTNYKYFLNVQSTLNTPAVYTLHSNTGKQLATLIDNQALVQKLANYELGTRELFTLTTSDGVQLNGWMVKPRSFDASKRYPVVMYQYSGPGSQQVLNQWGIGMSGQGAILEQYLAQQGYICVCVDGRGTGGRGADFEKCTYLKLGQLEARDQVEAALWLGQQSYVDKQRIAIWGWSYGGFCTLMSMSEGRGVFRAGIAIAPPTDWRFYDTIYTERYMRTPKENQQGYDDNPIKRAAQLKGELLLCHGLADDNVHYENTASYTEALIAADKDYQQLVYSDRNHSIVGGNTRNHLFRQCFRFLEKTMK